MLETGFPALVHVRDFNVEKTRGESVRQAEFNSTYRRRYFLLCRLTDAKVRSDFNVIEKGQR